MTRDEDQSWDRYWAHGFLTSCAEAFSGNYEGQMLKVWQDQFALLGSPARLLDICTGNGAIALIAAATADAHNKQWKIDAIDKASIYPQRAVADDARALLERIVFHAQTDAAATGFDEASFDLVTGHFALEYTDTPRTIVELARITAPGARAVFVLHHADSVILRTTRVELDHIAMLTGSDGLLERAKEFLTLLGNASPADRRLLSGVPEAERRRLALNDAAAAVSTALSSSPHPEILRTALGYVSTAFRLLESQGASQALAHLDTGRGEIIANLGRLQDLTRAALSPADLATLGSLFEKAGFSTPQTETLIDDEERLIGWLFATTRGGA